jgi:mannobiose 2-epimerase
MLGRRRPGGKTPPGRAQLARPLDATRAAVSCRLMKRHACLLLLASALAGPPPAMAAPAGAGTAPAAAPAVDRPALQAQLARVEAELRDDILPFWLQHARDRRRGGFHGEIANDLTIREDAPRGALLTARILWTFSAAGRAGGDPACLEMARWAYDDLLARFWDGRHGGLFWLVSADGKPLDANKEIYGQAFGIYALAEYYRATGERAALERAITLYRAIEQHARDRRHGGYRERFSRDWRPLPVRPHNPMGASAAKSQNTHLHVMEAYANLLRVWPDPELRRNLRDLVEVMLTRLVDPANHHLRLFLDEDWAPRSDGISYGHDIEFSWLLPEAADLLGDPDLAARARATALQIARVTLNEGIDADGGVFSEAGPRGLTDATKEWWPQAEAAVGFLNAYQLSGDPAFLRAALRSWDFIAARLVDHEHGEWFRAVERDGTVRRQLAKVSFWKCPYHNGRACLETIERLRAVLRASP